MEYVKILKRSEVRGRQAEWCYLLKRWDEVRTKVNPNAKWYDEPLKEDTYNRKD